MPMPKIISKTEVVGIPMIEMIGLILGAVLTPVIDWTLYRNMKVSGNLFYIKKEGTRGFSMTYGAVIIIALGIILAVFGQRFHKLLRWIGIGIIVAETSTLLRYALVTTDIFPESTYLGITPP